MLWILFNSSRPFLKSSPDLFSESDLWCWPRRSYTEGSTLELGSSLTFFEPIASALLVSLVSLL